MKRLLVVLLALGVLLAFASPALASPLTKAMSVDRPVPGAVKYAPTPMVPGERAIKPYPSYTYYSELGAILAKIDRQSSRVTVKVFGHSAGGRPMYLVTIQKPWASKAAKARWLKFIKLQTTNPAAAARMLKAGGDLRAPVFINASIHGGETTGVDASLMLLRKLAFGKDALTKKILNNDVVMINACQNPDGRVLDVRQNDNGFDLNRDWITQSQPEVKAMVKQIVKWHPTMFLDLHGYYNPMIIDPTTNPHNPNYEWDLSVKWALPAAESIEEAIEDNTIVEVDIPYRDWINPDTGKSEGFEDYSPYYTPQFAMYYGLVGSTMETSFKSEDGVDAHYYGILRGARYTAENRVGMLTDQINRFLRAVKGESQPVTDDIPEPITYPYAYIIPVDEGLQQDVLQARRAVRHLIRNGIQVKQATSDFAASVPTVAPAGGQVAPGTYPAGTYIVPLKQPLRGLANAMLWYGQDISAMAADMYDACAWQLPESWGFTRQAVYEPFSAAAKKVTTAADPAGVVAGSGPVYMIANDTNNGVKAVNSLLADAVKVERAVTSSDAVPLGAYLVTVNQTRVRELLSMVAAKYKVDAVTVDATGVETMPLYESDRRGAVTGLPKVGVYYDGPTLFALEQLGFDAELVAADADLSAYDVLVVDDTYGLDLDAVTAWIDGGGAYIANGPYGFIDGLLPVTAMGGVDFSFYWANNTLGLTQYDTGSLVTAGLGEQGFTFAFPITWFVPAVDADVAVDAAYDAGYFQAGFWRLPDPTGLVQADAAGQPVAVHGAVGSGRVTFFGPMTAFRAGTDATFRLLSNAVFTGSYQDMTER